jgi:hypothetical protein
MLKNPKSEVSDNASENGIAVGRNSYACDCRGALRRVGPFTPALLHSAFLITIALLTEVVEDGELLHRAEASAAQPVSKFLRIPPCYIPLLGEFVTSSKVFLRIRRKATS